ncbi:MAG: ABC transporter substrate-binding protein [Leptolinea sp.]
MVEIDKVVIGQPSAYINDPHIWVDSRAVLSIRFSIYESLVKYDKNNHFVAGLATEWSVSEDARTWTFLLRQGVQFHDGSIFDAEDAAASIHRAISPDMPGEYGTAALLAGYLEKAEISILDKTSIQIVTPVPMADLLDLLVYAVILPKKYFNNVTPSIPGTGPYKLINGKDGEIHLERFKSYWAGLAPVVSLVFKEIPEEQDRVKAFLDHKVDIITYISPDKKTSFDDCKEMQIIDRTTSVCVIFMFNASQGLCVDKRIRQALNYAANIDKIIDKLLHGNALRTNGPLTSMHSGYDPFLKPYQFNPEKAKELLKEAGFAGGLDLVLDRPARLPDESAQIAAMLREDWAAVGINLQERVHEDRKQYSLTVRAKQIGDMCVFDSSPMSTYRVLREKLHSKFAGPWWEGYENLQVNDLMEKAWATVDEMKRTDLYRQAYRLIQADAPWLFLYNPTEILVVRKSIVQALPAWEIGIDGLVLFGQG